MTGASTVGQGQAGASGDLATGAGGSTDNGSSGSAGASDSGGSQGGGGSQGSRNTAGSSASGGSAGKGGSSNAAGSGGSAMAHDAGSSGSSGRNVGSCSVDGGLPGGMMLLSEDFEDGTANGWNATVASDWSVVDDGTKVYKEGVSQGNSTVHLTAGGDVGWSNVIVEARVKPSFGGSSSSYFAGVCARLKDVDDFYCAALRSDGKFGIRARIGGNGTNLSNAINVTPTAISSDKWYTVKLKVQGSAIEGSVVGPAGETATAAVTDYQITNGGVGLAAVGMSAEFDDVKVTTP